MALERNWTSTKVISPFASNSDKGTWYLHNNGFVYEIVLEGKIGFPSVLRAGLNVSSPQY